MSSVEMEGTRIRVEPIPIALTGGILIDGCGGEPLKDSVVLINGKTIEEIGRKDKVRLRDGYKVIDVSGKTVMPGLIDLHVHLSWGENDVVRCQCGIIPTGLLCIPLGQDLLSLWSRRPLTISG